MKIRNRLPIMKSGCIPLCHQLDTLESDTHTSGFSLGSPFQIPHSFDASDVIIFAVVQLRSHVQLWGPRGLQLTRLPLSVGFSRQGCWSRLPFPSPGDLPDPRIKPMSPASAGRFLTAELPGKPSGTFQCMVVSHGYGISTRHYPPYKEIHSF